MNKQYFELENASAIPTFKEKNPSSSPNGIELPKLLAQYLCF